MERLYRGQPLVPLGFETLTVSTASVGFASIPTPARIAFVTVATSPIRISFGVTAPTSTTGSFVSAGGSIEVDSKLGLFRAIRDTTAGADATLTIHYFGTEAE